MAVAHSAARPVEHLCLVSITSTSMALKMRSHAPAPATVSTFLSTAIACLKYSVSSRTAIHFKVYHKANKKGFLKHKTNNTTNEIALLAARHSRVYPTNKGTQLI